MARGAHVTAVVSQLSTGHSLALPEPERTLLFAPQAGCAQAQQGERLEIFQPADMVVIWSSCLVTGVYRPGSFRGRH